MYNNTDVYSTVYILLFQNRSHHGPASKGFMLWPFPGEWLKCTPPPNFCKKKKIASSNNENDLYFPSLGGAKKNLRDSTPLKIYAFKPGVLILLVSPVGATELHPLRLLPRKWGRFFLPKTVTLSQNHPTYMGAEAFF